MRLVFFSHEALCTGGAQKCLLDLLKGIKQNHPEWQIYMIFPSRGEFIDTCSSYLHGYKVIKGKWWLAGAGDHVAINSKFSYVYKLLKSTIKLARYLRRIKPDYGITNTIVMPHLAFACKLLNIKHCWFIHEIPTATWNDINFLFSSRLTLRLVDRLSSKIMVTSEYAKHYYQEIMTENKVFAITQAVELESIGEVNTNRALHNKYSLLMVGAFDSNKGQLELLQAIKILVDAGKDVYCWLVGPDSGMMSKCKAYVEENGLSDKVELVPFVKQVYRYYFNADVLVVCSGFETFGRVAVEAQKCGVPVILSNVGANPERIKVGVNGLLYQKGNIIDLVAKIEMLRDPSVRKTFSDNINLDVVQQQYSADRFTLDFCALLNLE